MSFRILFTECPRWMSPFAYGGPSCKRNNSLSLYLSLIFLYKSLLDQKSSISGSFLGNPAFIENSVSGRFNVSL